MKPSKPGDLRTRGCRKENVEIVKWVTGAFNRRVFLDLGDALLRLGLRSKR